MNTAIGLFGGTFDPIHLGHIHVALSIYHALQLQAIRLIPAAQPALRDTPSASAEQRLAMVKLAIAAHDGLQVDDREIRRGGASYTIETLQQIRSEVGEHVPLCLMLSADQFCQFDQWKDWQQIIELAHLVITTRAGYTFSLNRAVKKMIKQRLSKDALQIHQSPSGLIVFQSLIPMKISGTQIRTLIHQGSDARSFLPPQVWEYIQKNGLYQCNDGLE